MRLILGNLSQLEPPLDDTFLGYTYQGDNLTDAYWHAAALSCMKIDSVEHALRDSGAATGNETSVTVLKQARGQKPPRLT